MVKIQNVDDLLRHLGEEVPASTRDLLESVWEHAHANAIEIATEVHSDICASRSSSLLKDRLIVAGCEASKCSISIRYANDHFRNILYGRTTD